MAIAGGYLGLEIDSFVGDLPFFRLDTVLLLINIMVIPLIPLIFRVLAVSFTQRQNRGVTYAAAVSGALYLLLIAFLAIYKSVCRIDFDFYFFLYNTDDALPVIIKMFAPWIPVILLTGAAFMYILKNAFVLPTRQALKSPKKARRIILTALFFCCVCQIVTLQDVRGSTAGFVYASSLSDRKLRDDYAGLYAKHIEALQESLPRRTDRFDPSALGDAVFIVKQESLNGLLANPEITPQLFRAGRDGVLIQKMYGNSIQSLRGYGCILCGVPPSITFALADAYPAAELEKLNCLPRIFQDLGYRTLYFFGGSRNPRIVHFAESIGFEKVLADDIMRPEDVKYNWGYREDIFYARVREYLKARYDGQKLFVFIDTGATNHAPFDVLDKSLNKKVPFPRPRNFTERISNTTFAQDAYFGILYDMFVEDYGDRGTLIAVSDHAWPIPVHKDNIFNERGAYEENFLISFLFVPPMSKAAEFDIGARVPIRFSQMDIQPAILDLLGMERPELLGESFAPWLLKTSDNRNPGETKATLSIQPYGGGFIALVKYPKKYLFSVLDKNVRIYDLEKDPGEFSPEIHPVDEYIPLIHDFFRRQHKYPDGLGSELWTEQ
jgi:phosphoglycerol transferase MdoB-like AlkP superfamily enzyme